MLCTVSNLFLSLGAACHIAEVSVHYPGTADGTPIDNPGPY